MKTEITRPTWEDVVFESRNKEYGAYPIRKSYDQNVSKASLIALFFAAFVFGCLQIASLMKVEIKIPPSICTLPGIINPPIVIPDPRVNKPTMAAEQKTNNDLLARIVKPDVIDPPPVKPIEATQVGSETGPTTEVIAVGVDSGLGVIATPVVVEPPKIFDIAQVMPLYEGGVSAMVNFLQRNLRYPASARSIGQEGTVYVRFVVNNAGQVVDVEVAKGVSAVLDREAMRVVALMKKWKPGMQHDIPVNVRMVLPIRFELER